jgi:uncharacterized protein YjbI with pentapeptide repeats
MELLGDEKLEVRLGGIYTLEQLAKDSPSDQSAVIEVLATFVRERVGWKKGSPVPDRLPPEIQVILTVLGRRAWSMAREDKPLDLHCTALAHAHLPFAHLECAFLYGANLENALLYRANLQGAWLAQAHMTQANLDEAHLEGADLRDAVGLTHDQLRTAYTDAKTVLPKYLK